MGREAGMEDCVGDTEGEGRLGKGFQTRIPS